MPIPKMSSKDLKSSIIGMILGDAYIGKGSRCKNAHIAIAHGPKQLEYLQWKTEILKQIPDTSYRFVDRDKFVKNKMYKTYESISCVHPYFTKIHNKFYKNNKKIVLREMLDKLTPIGLAIWYMDDGSACFRYRNNKTMVSNRAIKLCTHGFTLEENEIIQKYFLETYNIKCKIYKEYEKHYIWIQGKEAHKLLNIIAPYIIPCMTYKLDLKYINQEQPWLVRQASQ